MPRERDNKSSQVIQVIKKTWFSCVFSLPVRPSSITRANESPWKRIESPQVNEKRQFLRVSRKVCRRAQPLLCPLPPHERPHPMAEQALRGVEGPHGASHHSRNPCTPTSLPRTALVPCGRRRTKSSALRTASTGISPRTSRHRRSRLGLPPMARARRRPCGSSHPTWRRQSRAQLARRSQRCRRT